MCVSNALVGCLGIIVSGWWSVQLAGCCWCWLEAAAGSSAGALPCQSPLRCPVSTVSTTVHTVSRVKLGKQWETWDSDCHTQHNHLMRLLVTPHCHDQTRMHQHQTRNDKVFLSTCIKYFRWAGMSQDVCPARLCYITQIRQTWLRANFLLSRNWIELVISEA